MVRFLMKQSLDSSRQDLYTMNFGKKTMPFLAGLRLDSRLWSCRVVRYEPLTQYGLIRNCGKFPHGFVSYILIHSYLVKESVECILFLTSSD